MIYYYYYIIIIIMMLMMIMITMMMVIITQLHIPRNTGEQRATIEPQQLMFQKQA